MTRHAKIDSPKAYNIMTFLVAFMYILSLITIYLILVDAGQFGSFMMRNAKTDGTFKHKIGYFFSQKNFQKSTII